MDALVFLRERTRTRVGRVVFCLLCLLPVAGSLFGRIVSHAWAFMDIDAVLCAAKAEAVGASPYGTLVCSGLRPAAYVYAPQVAAAFMPLVHLAGLTGARWVFLACLFVPADLALLWYALARGLPGIDWRYRLLAFSGLSPMAFCSGNFGMVMHALVIFSLLIWPHRKGLFVALVLACAVVKPTFLLYFAVCLFEKRPWRARWAAVVLSGAAGIAVIAAAGLTAGPQGAAWRRALDTVALRDQPGLGWLAFTGWLNLAPDAPATIGLTLAFIAAMIASGVAVAEAADLTEEERLVLALGLVPLATPRLMDYDMLALAPCMALLMRVMPALGGRIYRYNMSWIFAGVLGFGVVNNVLHLRHWPRSYVAMGVFCFVVLAGGARVALTEWEKGRGPRARKKREKATLGGPLHIRRGMGGEDARRDVAGKVG